MIPRNLLPNGWTNHVLQSRNLPEGHVRLRKGSQKVAYPIRRLTYLETCAEVYKLEASLSGYLVGGPGPPAQKTDRYRDKSLLLQDYRGSL